MPIVLISSMSLDEMRWLASSAGVDSCLQKPLSKPSLLETINRLTD